MGTETREEAEIFQQIGAALMNSTIGGLIIGVVGVYLVLGLLTFLWRLDEGDGFTKSLKEGAAWIPLFLEPFRSKRR